jgi:hypothetical protein
MNLKQRNYAHHKQWDRANWALFIMAVFIALMVACCIKIHMDSPEIDRALISRNGV